ncbi:MAG: tRNA uridine-5-carboxymethylaminomethyl(34) synthesis GTPase MnmE [bacterium]
MKNNNLTIAAVSTPRGESGIAVIRMSGPESVNIIKKIFSPADKITKPKGRKVYQGWITDGREKIDEVMITFFFSPHSYTGEDVIEISCHGSVFITKRILELLIKHKARLAQPGEFTKKSFLSGKLDLSQAEAVADLIHAKTEASRRVALYQLKGNLSHTLNDFSRQLVQACSFLELELDFAEEDIEFTSLEDLGKMLQEIDRELKKFLMSYERGRLCREGVRMAIIGSPNVGKSSILNCLVEKERAIVTEVPGTTRDTIEDVLDIEGVLFTITDTAGLREVQDPIEKEGVRRAGKALDEADMILLVVDGSRSLSTEDRTIIKKVQEKGKKVLAVINKSDLKQRISVNELRKLIGKEEILSISALKKTGIDQLIGHLKHKVISGDMPVEGELLLTRERHKQAIVRTREHLHQAQKAIEDNMSQEFIAFDLRQALDALGEITGKKTTDDILDFIFSEFCVGK